MVLPDYREVFGGLTGAVTSLFWHDSVLTRKRHVSTDGTR